MSRSIPEELMELKKVLDTAFPTADNLNLDLFISRSIECGKDPSFLRGLQDLFSFLTREKEFINPIEIDLVYQLRKNIIATPNMDYIRFKEPVRKAVANRRKEDIRAINDILTATMSYPADQENHVRLKELQCTLQDASATAYAWYDYTLSGKIDHALYNMQNLNQKKVQTFRAIPLYGWSERLR